MFFRHNNPNDATRNSLKALERGQFHRDKELAEITRPGDLNWSDFSPGGITYSPVGKRTPLELPARRAVNAREFQDGEFSADFPAKEKEENFFSTVATSRKIGEDTPETRNPLSTAF